jgi:hypothetical protein
MDIDERIVERAKRLRESGPSVEDKRWMAHQVIDGRISAYKMAKLSKVAYTTVRRLRDQVLTDHILKEGKGRPSALDEISLERLRGIQMQIIAGDKMPISNEEWRDIIREEYSNSRRRRFPLENQARVLSLRSVKRYLLVVEQMGDLVTWI